uniref:Uncharacterized protein n=1 Tax=Glossina austeni TaxID=7395 RepID=A0A1A9V0G0_GLOAU
MDLSSTGQLNIVPLESDCRQEHLDWSEVDVPVGTLDKKFHSRQTQDAKLASIAPLLYVRPCHPSAAITAYSAETDDAVARDCDKLLRYLTSGRHEIDVVVVVVVLVYSSCLYQTHNSYYAQSLPESFASFLIYWHLWNNVSFDVISVAFITIKPTWLGNKDLMI